MHVPFITVKSEGTPIVKISNVWLVAWVKTNGLVNISAIVDYPVNIILLSDITFEVILAGWKLTGAEDCSTK